MNPYYSPEDLGLTQIVFGDDPNACYSFDMFVVWQEDATGDLYYGTDAGCSCPSPFEWVNSLADLTKYTDWDTFVTDVEAWGNGLSYSDGMSDAEAMEVHEIKTAVMKAGV